MKEETDVAGRNTHRQIYGHRKQMCASGAAKGGEIGFIQAKEGIQVLFMKKNQKHTNPNFVLLD